MDATPHNDLELVLTRVIDAPRHKVFRCWTVPEIMPRWFVPRTWSIARAEVDLRPGGSSLVVMRSPEGEEIPNRVVFLEVVPDRKLVFTDAFTEAWIPSAKPFFVGTIELTDEADGKTSNVARAAHWTREDRDAHEKMGFHEGWGQCATQLEEVARTI